MHFKRLQKGFTLIEMMVSMSIFVVFVGVLIASYTDIVRSQSEANEYRVLYSEARRVFDKITEEVRGNAISYDLLGSRDDLRLTSADGERFVVFGKRDGQMWYGEKVGDELAVEYPLLAIKEFSFYVTPSADPYDSENVYLDGIQFQPKVTVFAEFEMDDYTVDLQTTISSRLYSQSPNVFNYSPKFNE